MNKTALNTPATRSPISKIRAITVDNFQSIGHMVLKLGNLTIIRGESRAGKSAFIRAVQAAVENRRGGDYVRAGGKMASVTIEADDCVVDWSHGGGVNDYKITVRGEVNEYKKVGATVPDRVREIINMSRMEFGAGVECNLNFSGQLDELFLVQGNPSDNAKIIGAVSDLNSIYNGMREAERVMRELKRAITASEASIEVKEQEVLRLGSERDRKAKIGKTLRELFDECQMADADAVVVKFIMDGVRDSDLTGIDSRIDRHRVARVKIEECVKDVMLVTSEAGEINAIIMELSKSDLTGIDSCINRHRVARVKIEECVKDAILVTSEAGEINAIIMELPKVDDILRAMVSELKQQHNNLGVMEQNIATVTVCQTCGAERKYWRVTE